MRTLATALMLSALLACSGSGLQVKTEQDWDTDFGLYRTYAWGQGVPARDPAIESRIRTAVDFELPFKGLKKVPETGSPDLRVSTYVSVEEQRVVDHWSYELGPAGTGSSRALTLPVGTLVIDLVDARSGKLVWRGRVDKVVDREVSEAAVRKAVREIFRGYR
jgi:uncharacterized protein DUF4136